MTRPGRPRTALAFLLGILFLGTVPWPRDPSPPILRGQVLAAGRPVEGARVRCPGEDRFVLSESGGHFRLACRSAQPARVTASKEGFFIGGAPAASRPLIIHLKPLPTDDCEEYAWVDPAPRRSSHQCGTCHQAIFQEWTGSAHARSAANPHLRNLYDGTDWHGRPQVGWNLLADHADGAGVCNACHAPTAEFDADLRSLTGPAAQGVHCDYCHKVADVLTDHLGLTHGRFATRLLRPAQGQLFFGPLDDVDRDEDAFAAVYSDSRYCAACHEGTVFGVHVYSTYAEWLTSPARREGKQCQSCHMAPTGTLTNLAPGRGGLPRAPHTLASHQLFAGGQKALLRACLKVTVAAARGADEVRAEVTVRADQVGHRVPTGFIDRNLVLVVEAADGADRPLPPRTGPLLPAVAGREVAGRAGRLYARQLHHADNPHPLPFWLPPDRIEDSRLPPQQPDTNTFTFPPTATQLRIRILHRRFWPEVAETKHWPDNEIPVLNERLSIPEEGLRWSGP